MSPTLFDDAANAADLGAAVGWATVVLLAASVWLLMSALVVGLHALLRGHLAQLSPARRARLLLAACLTPIVVACVTVVLQGWPAFARWLVHAHCHDGVGCAAHLPHSAAGISAGATLFIVLLAVGMALVLLGRLVTASARHWRVKQRLAFADHWTQRFDVSGHAVSVCVMKSGGLGAFSVGLLRPQVWITSALQDGLAAADLQAVIAHEWAHGRRRDGLRQLLANALLPPGVFGGTRLGQSLTLANEQAADLQATNATGGSSTDTAGALIAACRLSLNAASATEGRTPHHGLEGRIMALLDPPTGPVRYRLMATGLLVAGLAFALLGADWLHILAERLL